MKNTLCIASIVFLVSYSSGLNLNLDFKETPIFGASSAACVLTCEETYVRADTSLDHGQATSNSSNSSITGMQIFAAMTSQRESCDTGNGELIASLTLQQPNISTASNNVRIKGRLNAKRASLRIELINDRDCSAGFTCEVLTKDENGRETKSSNRLHGHLQQKRDRIRDGSVLTSSESSQTMLIIQQLALLENRLEDKIGSIENKIESRIVKKLDSFEAKLHSEIAKGILETNSRGCSCGDLRVKQEEILNKAVSISERVETSLNKSMTILSSIEAQLKQQQNCSITSLNATGQREELLIEWLNLQIKSSVSFQNLLLEKLNHIDVNPCNISTGYLFPTHNPISKSTNTLNTSSTTSPMTTQSANTTPTSTATIIPHITTTASSPEPLLPQNCSKGMNFSYVAPGFPYPVVYPNDYSELDVPYLCDQTTDGGGWIIIQRRSTGQEDFYRDWVTYKNGFGSLDGDFWIGNEHIHTLTSHGTYELRVEMEHRGTLYFAQYDTFYIDSEEKNYALRIGRYHGNATNSLIYHDRAPFSTYDNDNGKDTRNCAKLFVGAWWYKSCHTTNLNGMWGAQGSKGMIWNGVTSSSSVTLSEMKIRSVDPL